MTVEEAEKILGVESKMSYDEVLRVRPQPSARLPKASVAAVRTQMSIVTASAWRCHSFPRPAWAA